MNAQHKLTAQIVAAYPNAQVSEIKTGAIGNVLEIHFKSDSLFVNEGDFGGYYSETHNFQLVLTSPDKITDAQALEVAKEYYPGMYHAHNIEYILSVFKRYNQNVRSEGKYATELSDICRNYNIDMGYGSIPSLITAGLAVEKNKEQ